MHINVKVKNTISGEVYFEMEFDQHTGVDLGMGTNVGTQYIPSSQVHHVQLELCGAVVIAEPEQLQLSL